MFVEVATREYGIRGRPTNVSRVAILTGIGRREVGLIRQALAASEPPLPNQTADATRLLSGWHQDADVLGPDGLPLELAAEGPGPSFESLARRYSPDVAPGTMLKELQRVGAVGPLVNARVRVLRRFYQPVPLDPQWILNAGSVFADLGVNINHNLAAGEGRPSRFLGRATETRVDADSVAAFQAFLETEGQQFLERVDAWLARHRLGEQGLQEKTAVRLGVGLFMIKGDPDKESGHE
ncbi:hypothetical protein GPROT2_03125 [Gammaproteobacteria bacterium]|nr:hypothetical protein [Gammaproteobacteria bacterium]QOJ32712.1 MAG: hypothetical protein HRU81_11630 [Gammaproteobacteria bacterium]CAG0945267.1 hypothetical protein GPROT2_03125 [Gammaproteobacteria bacterium]